MFNMKMFLFGAIGLMIASLGIGSYVMYGTIQDQEIAISGLEQKVQDQSAMVLKMKEGLADLKRQQEIIDNGLSKVQGEFSKTQKSLENFIGRDQTVAKKPKLVERKIQASYDKFTTDFNCVTGGCK